MKVYTQRWRLYDAEREVFGNGAYFSNKEACQGYLDRMVKTKWWVDRSPIEYVRAEYPVYSWSGAHKLDEKNARIDYYCTSLNVHTSCHEMGHIFHWIPGKNDERDHNAAFAGGYLAIVRRFMSAKHADELQLAFDKYGVKYKLLDD